VEAALGEQLGITAAGTAEELRETLAVLGSRATIPLPAAEVLYAAATRDKKARKARPRTALIERCGVPARSDSGGWTHEFELQDLQGAVGRLK
jgi:3-dehydroquinate synthetase